MRTRIEHARAPDGSTIHVFPERGIFQAFSILGKVKAAQQPSGPLTATVALDMHRSHTEKPPIDVACAEFEIRNSIVCLLRT